MKKSDSRVKIGELSKRFLLSLTLAFCASAVFAEDGLAWLSKTAKPIEKGTTEWTLILTTGHFGLDPQLAAATRTLALEMLNKVGAKGDKVRVISGELQPWGEAKVVPIEELAASLPTSSAPNSKGGRDLEALISDAAGSATGSVLLLAPGDSQLPIDGKGVLRGGTINAPGFAPPARGDVDVDTPSGPRHLRAIYLQKGEPSTGVGARTPLENPVTSKPASEVKTSRPVAENSSSPSTPLWPMLLVGALILGLGIVVGKLLGPKPVAQEFTTETPPSEPASTGSELEDWKQAAKALQRKLDVISQDLADGAAAVAQSGQDQSIELRQEIARHAKSLAVWDETAMDYLDGIQRALADPGVSDQDKRAWRNAENQFIRLIQRAGLDVIAPELGSNVIDGHHRIDGTGISSTDIASGSISSLVYRGYRRGDVVLRQAKVEIAS